MRLLLVGAALVVCTATSTVSGAQAAQSDQPASGCMECHRGIEPIREHDSKMAQEIYRKGLKQGDPNGCVVCHFGDARSTDKDMAHKEMIRFPASM